MTSLTYAGLTACHILCLCWVARGTWTTLGSLTLILASVLELVAIVCGPEIFLLHDDVERLQLRAVQPNEGEH